MKLPKETRRYCPTCKKHTKQKIEIAKQKARSATHPLSRGSKSRTKLRHESSGLGNRGKYSKKGVRDWKMKTKVTRRLVVLYRCTECGKAKTIKKAIRTSRIEIGEKVSK